jgi:putative NADH-flavin reductase
MNLLILGASGATGMKLVTQALARGHSVTAFSRHPERVGIADRRLESFTGDVAEDRTAIARALPGHDAVLSALGRGLSFSPQALMARATANIVRAMEGNGPRRLVFLSAFGVGPGHDGATGLSWLFFTTLLRGIYADKTAGEAVIRASTLDWTLVNPPILTNDPSVVACRSGERLELPSMAKMSRASTAAFMLDCLTDKGTIRKRLIICP